jgi:hypothetical protein
MERLAFLDYKIGKKSEKKRNCGQCCWVMFSGSRVDFQKKGNLGVSNEKIAGKSEKK